MIRLVQQLPSTGGLQLRPMAKCLRSFQRVLWMKTLDWFLSMQSTSRYLYSWLVLTAFSTQIMPLQAEEGAIKPTSLWPYSSLSMCRGREGKPLPLTEPDHPGSDRSMTPRCPLRLFCSLAVLDPRVGHTMDILSPFIPVLCHSD